MSDVFISYARSTADQARMVAEALRAAGYGVWRDDEIPAHRSFAEVIEERLKAARAVVVIWSAEAVKSEWVQSEADRARQDRKLVQLTIDGAPLPMPFDRIQCADLAGWNGDQAAQGWRKVAESVAALARSASLGEPSRATVVAAPPAEPRLAVLAFDNLSGDPEMAYFSDGVSEEILDTVARGSNLKVIGRSSSFQFRGADKAAARVASALRATHLLDGSVRRAGQRVRIAARLVDCASETTLWSDRFDGELTDVFALQDEIAESVAQALKAALAPAKRPSVIRPETYEIYLRALEKSGTSHILIVPDAVVPMLEQVTAESPSFAAAWHLLAWARAGLLRSGRRTQSHADAHADVVAAAETALRLDPTSGRAYVALAFLQPFAARAARLSLLRRGMAANPNDSQILIYMSATALTVGRAQVALDYALRAYEIDPLYESGKWCINMPLRCLGRYQEALEHCDAWARSPGIDGQLLSSAITTAGIAGDWARFDRFTALKSPDQTLPWFDNGHLRFLHNLRTDDRAGMRADFEQMRRTLAETGTVPLNAITTLEHYGMRDEAYALAEEAAFDHLFRSDGPMPAAGFTPAIIFDHGRYGSLVDDPRFVRLCAKLGLVSYWLETDEWPDCANKVAYDFRAEARKASAEGLALHV
ncbi:MAG TPA: TIR domain-containing protein [Caulobacteraceae bacterium]|nr:TIR domain-containing protein [Caulobacteraceae bacterium]